MSHPLFPHLTPTFLLIIVTCVLFPLPHSLSTRQLLALRQFPTTVSILFLITVNTFAQAKNRTTSEFIFFSLLISFPIFPHLYSTLSSPPYFFNARQFIFPSPSCPQTHTLDTTTSHRMYFHFPFPPPSVHFSSSNHQVCVSLAVCFGC